MHNQPNTKYNDSIYKVDEVRKKALLVFAYIIFLFVVAQVLGIYVGNFIIQDAKHNEVVSTMLVISGPPIGAVESAFYMLFYVLLGAFFMFILIKFYKGNFLFMLIEFSVVSFASSIVFYALIRPFIQGAPELPIVLAIFMGLILATLKLKFSELRNLVAVLSTAGAGALFGFFLTFPAALLFLVLLSIYDYIAVFKTKHMVKMAQSISKKEMSFVITSKQMTMAGEIGFELGTGDMLMPIVLEVSGFQLNPTYSIIIFISSIFALLALFILLSRKKTTLPALPVIAFFNIIFLISAFFLHLV